MSVLLSVPYDVNVFNRLPDIDTSHKRFRALNGLEVISTELKDLFVRYEITNFLGLILLHKHFSLERNQMLVEVNGSSTPWDLRALQPTDDGGYEKNGGRVLPCSWRICGAGLVPYEFSFYYQPESDLPSKVRTVMQPGSGFLENLNKLLETYGLSDSLGITMLQDPSQMRLEFTEGKANITHPVSGKVPQNYLEAIWNFVTVKDDIESPPFITRGCAGYCIRQGDTHLDGHRNIRTPSSP